MAAEKRTLEAEAEGGRQLVGLCSVPFLHIKQVLSWVLTVSLFKRGCRGFRNVRGWFWGPRRLRVPGRRGLKAGGV